MDDGNGFPFPMLDISGESYSSLCFMRGSEAGGGFLSISIALRVVECMS